MRTTLPTGAFGATLRTGNEDCHWEVGPLMRALPLSTDPNPSNLSSWPAMQQSPVMTAISELIQEQQRPRDGQVTVRERVQQYEQRLSDVQVFSQLLAAGGRCPSAAAASIGESSVPGTTPIGPIGTTPSVSSASVAPPSATSSSSTIRAMLSY